MLLVLVEKAEKAKKVLQSVREKASEINKVSDEGIRTLMELIVGLEQVIITMDGITALLWDLNTSFIIYLSI